MKETKLSVEQYKRLEALCMEIDDCGCKCEGCILESACREVFAFDCANLEDT